MLSILCGFFFILFIKVWMNRYDFFQADSQKSWDAGDIIVYYYNKLRTFCIILSILYMSFHIIYQGMDEPLRFLPSRFPTGMGRRGHSHGLLRLIRNAFALCFLFFLLFFEIIIHGMDEPLRLLPSRLAAGLGRRGHSHGLIRFIQNYIALCFLF